MKLSQISYQRVFPVGNYATERIGLEATLDETDNPQTALEHLKQMVLELHQETMQSIENEDDMRGTKVTDVVEEAIDDISPEERLNREINNCNSIPVLETFKLLVAKNPSSKDVYDKKYLELSGK